MARAAKLEEELQKLQESHEGLVTETDELRVLRATTAAAGRRANAVGNNRSHRGNLADRDVLLAQVGKPLPFNILQEC